MRRAAASVMGADIASVENLPPNNWCYLAGVWCTGGSCTFRLTSLKCTLMFLHPKAESLQR